MQGVSARGLLPPETDLPPPDFIARDCEARGASVKMLIFDCLVAIGILERSGSIEDANTLINYVLKNMAGLSSDDKRTLVPLLHDLSVSFRKTDSERSKIIENILIETVKQVSEPSDLFRARYMIMYAQELFSAGNEIEADKVMGEVCLGFSSTCNAQEATQLIDYVIGPPEFNVAQMLLMAKSGFFKKPISPLQNWQLRQSLKISRLSKERPREDEIRLRLGEDIRTTGKRKR